MGFKASEVLDELSYDFTPHADIQGVTPEPSSLQITKFQHTLREIFAPLAIEEAKRRDAGPLSPGEIEEALRSTEDGTAQLDALIEAVATVCSNHPTKAQLRKLPYRLQMHFIGYMAGKFLRPEVSTLVTS